MHPYSFKCHYPPTPSTPTPTLESQDGHLGKMEGEGQSSEEVCQPTELLSELKEYKGTCVSKHTLIQTLIETLTVSRSSIYTLSSAPNVVSDPGVLRPDPFLTPWITSR